MRECAEMLDTLGVSWVQAAGEAEFSAARLNAEGKVDAIITDDSDAFCFGAVRVLRNFTISGKLISYYLCLISSKFLDFAPILCLHLAEKCSKLKADNAISDRAIR